MVTPLDADIVMVVDYWDEGGLPWNFVKRTGDGFYQATARYTVDFLFQMPNGADGEIKEYSVGIFPTVDAAERALRRHLDEIRTFTPLELPSRR